jgi:agmatinase
MRLHNTPFLSPPTPYGDLESSRVAILPFPYEGGISYGKGAAGAPQAILEASQQVEFYDEVLDAEPFRVGIATLAPPPVPEDARQMVDLVSQLTDELLSQDKLVVLIGGDHSISPGYVRSIAKHHERFGVIQLDAHADLRNTYGDSPLSHACAMARIRDITPHTLQIGIRSMAAEEALIVKQHNLRLCTMEQWRRGKFDLKAALAALPEKVYITLDVDVFDWSVVAGTGTPEPGGLLWHEALQMLQTIFETKDVIGWDVVELAFRDTDPNSPYAVAKLIYKMIGYKFHSLLPVLP